jgi:murein DD-endopeptidase MepM/ murein hydrolase activator NlpD
MIFKKSYSLLIVPHDSGHGKAAFLHSKHLNLFVASLIIVLGVSGFFIIRHCLYYHKLKIAFAPTFKENEILRAEQQGYGQVKDSLSTDIEKLQAQLRKERLTYLSSVGNLARQVDNLRKLAVKVKIQAGFKSTSIVEEDEAAGGPESPVYIGKYDNDQPIEISKLETIINPYISNQIAELKEVDNFLGTKESLLSATPELAPLFGKMTSNFGVRRWRKSGHVADHYGLDIAVPKGTPVCAPAEGVVTICSWTGDYGNLIELDHGTGYTTRFGHLSKYNVEIGDRVQKGQAIGLVGSTGHSTGPHLHYEVRYNGTPIDPIDYMGELNKK